MTHFKSPVHPCGSVIRLNRVMHAMRRDEAHWPNLVSEIQKAVGFLTHGGASEASQASAATQNMERMGLLRQRVPLRLEWSGLSFHIGDAAVLEGLDAHVEHGELVALMGESGSGKSTLLNVLGGRASYGKLSGTLELNGHRYAPHRLKHIVGFVLQSYVLFDELTVFENLDLAASLRSPKGETVEHRQRRVTGLLSLLGLYEVRDFVLDRSIGMGRLSGGQMRRVGIGVELAADASILLLDEPTSALDAVNTRLVVGLLRALANSGMMVIASIHQPRLSAFEMFDQLLLLRKGQLAYGGAAGKDAVNYFATLGYTLPDRHNPADFFIEVCFGFVDSQARPPTQLHELGGRWHDAYARLCAEENARDAARFSNATASYEEFERLWTADKRLGMLDTASAADVYQATFERCFKACGGQDAVVTWSELLHTTRTMPLPRSSLPSALHQFRVCLKRVMLKRVRRRRRFAAQTLIMVGLSAIAGGITGPAVVSDASMLVATVALFGTYVATQSIETCCQGAEDELFEHEVTMQARPRTLALRSHLADSGPPCEPISLVWAVCRRRAADGRDSRPDDRRRCDMGAAPAALRAALCWARQPGRWHPQRPYSHLLHAHVGDAAHRIRRHAAQSGQRHRGRLLALAHPHDLPVDAAGAQPHQPRQQEPARPLARAVGHRVARAVVHGACPSRRGTRGPRGFPAPDGGAPDGGCSRRRRLPSQEAALRAGPDAQPDAGRRELPQVPRPRGLPAAPRLLCERDPMERGECQPRR